LHVFDGVFTLESSTLALDVLAKLGIGAFLGGAIGLERERSGRPAGIRTHMLMVMGVVLLCEVSKAFGAPDNSRIAAQIVTGVGFLGAGTIMRTGLEVKGLTTAASLWAASAIGFAVSTGGAFLIIAGAATVLALFTLAVVDNLESRLAPEGHLRELNLKVDSRENASALIEFLKEKGFHVQSVRITPTSDAFQVQLGVYGRLSDLLSACTSHDGVLTVE